MSKKKSSKLAAPQPREDGLVEENGHLYRVVLDDNGNEIGRVCADEVMSTLREEVVRANKMPTPR